MVLSRRVYSIYGYREHNRLNKRKDKRVNNQPIWEQDLMPEKSVVIDFYQEYKLSQEQQNQALWERIEDDELADTMPGYPAGTMALAQWRVVSGEREWMIYQWWEGTGTDDDVYLYEVVK
jgi:hypothetical protein